MMEKEMKDKHDDFSKAEAFQAPAILEEITIDELAVDGICGIY